MADRLWCSECSRERYHYDYSDEPATCRNCDNKLVDPPTSVIAIWRLKQGVALSILAAIFIGPIAWVAINIGDKPLYATRTVEVTMTEPYGLIPGIAPFLFLWLIMYIIAWAASGTYLRP